MITIINGVKKIPLEKNYVQELVAHMLEALGYQDFAIGIRFTSNATIRRYNRDYRHKDKATDILSFPFHPEHPRGKRLRPRSTEEKNLGDMIISLEYVKEHASEWNRTFDNHLRAMLAHGIAHLLNYDHQTDEEFHQMQKIERKLLQALQHIASP